MTLTYDALKKENEELRKRAETAEHELTVDLSYQERWQQARAENQELRAKLAGMKQEKANKQKNIDISNLRFYATLFRQYRWETDVFHWNVFEATLNEITGRIATEWEDADQEADRG